MQTLPDRRCPSMPNVPHSAYCRVCWNAVYCLWVDGSHDGRCPHGASVAHECRDAVAAASNSAAIRAALSAAAKRQEG